MGAAGLQDGSHRAGLDGRARAVRVHLASRRREHRIHASGFELRDILIEGSRVSIQILALRELQWINENTDSHERARHRLRGLNQRQVPLVQRPHGRDQTHWLACLAHGARDLAEVLNTVEYGGFAASEWSGRG